MDEKTKRIIVTTCNIILLVIATALIVFGGVVLKESYDCNKKIAGMEKPLAQIPVDFSEPNEYLITLPTVKKYFHGLGLWIKFKTHETDENKLDKLIKGIRGHIIAKKPNNEIICDFPFTYRDLVCYVPEAEREKQIWNNQKKDFLASILLVRNIPEYASNSSTIILKINHGTQKLKGIKQTLTVKYRLCGLDKLVVIISSIIGSVSTLAGLGIGVSVTVFWVRKRKSAQSHRNSKYGKSNISDINCT